MDGLGSHDCDEKRLLAKLLCVTFGNSNLTKKKS